MNFLGTVKTNDKNTRTVETANGTKLVLSVRAYPLPEYIGGIWLPSNVQIGDVVDYYIDQVKAEEKGDKTYYNAVYAKASKNYQLSEDLAGGSNSYNPAGNDFGQSQGMDISDSDLPF